MQHSKNNKPVNQMINRLVCGMDGLWTNDSTIVQSIS